MTVLSATFGIPFSPGAQLLLLFLAALVSSFAVIGGIIYPFSSSTCHACSCCYGNNIKTMFRNTCWSVGVNIGQLSILVMTTLYGLFHGSSSIMLSSSFQHCFLVFLMALLSLELASLCFCTNIACELFAWVGISFLLCGIPHGTQLSYQSTSIFHQWWFFTFFLSMVESQASVIFVMNDSIFFVALLSSITPMARRNTSSIELASSLLNADDLPLLIRTRF